MIATSELIDKLVIVGGFMFIIGCTSQKAIPVDVNGIYSIEIDNMTLEVDPMIGGRITALKAAGKNFLTDKEVHPEYWGSTLWPSPQKDWGGSPPAELDNQPYSHVIENNVIKMTSHKDVKFGYTFSKEIYADKKRNYFSIKYTIANGSQEVRKVAPWEVTRVHTKGLAFYPTGTGQRRGNLAGFAKDKDAITWFDYKEDDLPATHNKFFADGSEGWIAQVNGDLIFIKSFPDIAAEKAAPAESEIEVYTNAAKTYVEIEQQGAYENLNPGQSLSWQVKWYLRKIPDNINCKAGSADLVSFVRKVLR